MDRHTRGSTAVLDRSNQQGSVLNRSNQQGQFDITNWEWTATHLGRRRPTCRGALWGQCWLAWAWSRARHCPLRPTVSSRLLLPRLLLPRPIISDSSPAHTHAMATAIMNRADREMWMRKHLQPAKPRGPGIPALCETARAARPCRRGA